MKRNEILDEHKKGVRAVIYNKKPKSAEPPKPRNPVAKNAGAAIGGGAAGAHKNEKKASQAVRGQKHKAAEVAESVEDRTSYQVAKELSDRGIKYDPAREDDLVKAIGMILIRELNMSPKQARSVMNDEDFLSDTMGELKHMATDTDDEWYDRNGRPNPNGAYDADGHYHLDRDVEEMIGRKSSYYNPMDYERDQQRQMDYDKREFKRQELQHELGHEDDPDFERKLKQQAMDRDRGPWFLKVNGKILKVKGEPKVFDWKNGASKYGQAILKNRPELQGKIFLTKKNQDDVAETGEPIGKVTKVDPATKKVTVTKPDNTTMEVDPTDLKSTPDGKVQMSQPELKPGTDVVSTEDMMAPPNDSQSAIHGGQDHDEISKLLVKRLRRLAGL